MHPESWPCPSAKHGNWGFRALRAVLWITLLFSLGCATRQRDKLPFSTPFGVGVGDAPVTAAQLDAIGPVWYMDWRWDTPAIDGHERLYVIRCWEVERDQGAILSAMQASGTAWWSLGNEPNDPHQDNVSPEDYAELYHVFEGWASSAPGCHILPAGIANADWEWAEAFREASHERYGRYPRVDGWNIHNYILEAGLDPYDVGEFQRRILAFHRWIEAIGDERKPLFLTEYGVLYGDGCCDRPVDPPEKMRSFMRDSTRWLRDTDIVTCWAWFATYCELYNGDLLTREGRLTDVGRTYRELVQTR
jgi:hypothetical protein